MNTKMLKSKMILSGDNQTDLAKVLEISNQRLSAKLNAKDGAQFTQGEIEIIKNRYSLTPEEINQIFFT